jgi:hypothetical protein
MVEPTFQALLVSATSGASLLESTNPPTDQTAVTLSAITVRTDEEQGAAF